VIHKQQYPEENEIVLCTVTKIQFNSVFVNLDEYRTGGMIHISEISPGRIRNIRDYVKEGKKIICKVLRINKDRGHIDLSLRRVTESQRRQKSEAQKLEQKAKKIVELIAMQLKKDKKILHEQVVKAISVKFKTLHQFFSAIVSGDASALDILPEDIAKPLDELVKVRMKPAEITIKRLVVLQSYEPDGIKDMREALQKGQEQNKDIKIRYEGAGRFKVSITALDYKKAEKDMQQTTDIISEEMEKREGTATVSE